MLPLSHEVDSQPRVNFATLLPYSVVHGCGHTLTVGVRDNLQISQLWHLGDILHQVVTQVVRGDDQTPEVGEGGDRHHGQRGASYVDDLQRLQRQIADLTDLVQDMFPCDKVSQSQNCSSQLCPLTILAIKLEIHQLQPLQPWETVEKILHVLENHPPSAVYLHLVIGFGKVAGENIGEALDVGKFSPVDVAPPDDRIVTVLS